MNCDSSGLQWIHTQDQHVGSVGQPEGQRDPQKGEGAEHRGGRQQIAFQVRQKTLLQYPCKYIADSNIYICVLLGNTG